MRLLPAIFLVITVICFWKMTQIDGIDNKKSNKILKNSLKVRKMESITKRNRKKSNMWQRGSKFKNHCKQKMKQFFFNFR